MDNKHALTFIILALAVGAIGMMFLTNLQVEDTNESIEQERMQDVETVAMYAQQRFNEITKEINYWHNQPEGSIGKVHHDALLQRLQEMEGMVPTTQIEEYTRRLNEIVLVEQEPRTESNVEINSEIEKNTQNTISQTEEKYQNPEIAGCEGKGPVTFSSPPRKLGDIEFFEPMGMMIGNHVTPVDHGYFYPINWKSEPQVEDLKEVLVPGDGVITSIGRMPTYFSMKGEGIEDYRVIIHHTCTFYSIYIHVSVLSESIKEKIGDIEPGNTIYPSIPVKAGEVLGRANAFDFSVHNDETVLTGFIVPEHYQRETWKIHTIDPLERFIEPVRSQLIAKTIRSTAPYGGRIDWDVDGTLQGNWFIEGTNGYQGVTQPEYWDTHVSFSPNVLDENNFVISLGNYNNEPRQFGAKGNMPHPKKVTPQTGIVKYELVDINYVIGKTGQHWNGISFAKDLKVQPNGGTGKGTVLVQMLDGRKLKLEVFPGKSASQVDRFTSNAKVYER